MCSLYVRPRAFQSCPRKINKHQCLISNISVFTGFVSLSHFFFHIYIFHFFVALLLFNHVLWIMNLQRQSNWAIILMIKKKYNIYIQYLKWYNNEYKMWWIFFLEPTELRGDNNRCELFLVRFQIFLFIYFIAAAFWMIHVSYQMNLIPYQDKHKYIYKRIPLIDRYK